MEYRIKEVEKYGKTYYYPQYKKRWFWRRFVWWGGEDGYTPHTVFYSNINSARLDIENDKKKRKQKALAKPKKPIYHYVN